MAHDSRSTRTVETTVHLDAEPPDVLLAFLGDADLKGWWHVTRSLVPRGIDGTAEGLWCPNARWPATRITRGIT